MHETDRSLLGDKDPTVGCGVAQGSGGTHGGEAAGTTQRCSA